MRNPWIDSVRSLTRRSPHGFTLLELLLVVAMVGILTCAANWSVEGMAGGWRLRRAGQQVLEDLKATQARAEMTGSLALGDGRLIMQNSFLVFDPAARQYAAYLWQDRDGDGTGQAGEADLLWRRSLPNGISFSWAAGVDRRACSNSSGAPGSAVSFASPNYAPCDDRPCIKFDRHGFSVIGPGAIYLSDGAQSLAITATRPGHFTLCEWNGAAWR